MRLGPNGVEEIHQLEELSTFENDMFNAMLPDLMNQIDKGISYAKMKLSSPNPN